YTLIDTAYTMIEIPNLLLDKSFRDRVVSRVRVTPSTKLFWKSYDSLRLSEQEEKSESTRDRIDRLVSNPILYYNIGQSQTSINFKEIMDEGKILLAYLPKQFGSMSSLLGSILISQLLLAALSRGETTKRRLVALYVDEFQNYA